MCELNELLFWWKNVCVWNAIATKIDNRVSTTKNINNINITSNITFKCETKTYNEWDVTEKT